MVDGIDPTLTTTGHAEFGPVAHPVHYNAHPSGLECIEVTRLMSFTLGNAVKYVWRADLKNGVEDLRKARWYLADTLTSGQSWYPSHRAKAKLLTVAEDDPEEARRDLFNLIAYGRLDAAIVSLDGLIDHA